MEWHTAATRFHCDVKRGTSLIIQEMGRVLVGNDGEERLQTLVVVALNGVERRSGSTT